MKRNIFLSVALLFTSILMQASPITGRQAADKARAFLYGNSKMKFASGTIDMATPADGIQPYYVFNIGTDGGFVIVSGDDAAYPVVGYSRKGHLDVNNLPENMKTWLDAYASDIQKIQKMNLPEYKAVETRAEKRPVIHKLITSEWNQLYPYNLHCPKYPGDNDRRPTGCVATAMAQVMYYFKWPAEETQPIPGYSYVDEPTWGGDGTDRKEEALAPTVFDWESMTDKYDFYSDKKSEEAVAELMNYVGHSVSMMYGVQASGAYSEDIAGAMVKYFGYKNTARIVYRSHYRTQNEWEELMYRELAENRPILYSGVTKDNAGHQFVCDGYEDGFFHINWGWGGLSDGFFKLAILDPYNQGTGGAGTGMAFSELQSAIIGIDKPDKEDCVSVDSVKAEAGSEVKFEIALNNLRKNYTSMQFDLSLPEGVDVSYDEAGMPKVNFVKSRSEKGDHEIEVSKVSVGIYRFVVYSPSNSCITGKEGAVIEATGKVSANVSVGDYTAHINNVLMCNTHFKGFDILGCDFNINVSGSTLLLGDADENGIVDDNDITSIINNIINAGDCQINVKQADVDADGIVDIHDAMLTSDIILKNTGGERFVVDTETDYNDTFAFAPYDNELLLSLKNNTCYKAFQFDLSMPEGVMLVEDHVSERAAGFEMFCASLGNGKYRVLCFTRNGRNIEGNEGVVAHLSTDKLVYKAKISNIVMVTSDLRKMLLKDVDYKLPTGIDEVAKDMNDKTSVYTLEGIRVDSSVMNKVKGVYIVGGKKMIIR